MNTKSLFYINSLNFYFTGLITAIKSANDSVVTVN